MAITLEPCDDPAARAAGRLLECVRPGAHIVLTGGSTPREAYARAARRRDGWGGTTLWWGDERCVPASDDRSNYGMAREALLDSLDPAPEVRRMAGELGPHAGARRYERELRDAFGAGPPAFDLVLLGLGPDGHCASLFPGSPALEVRDRYAVGVNAAPLAPHVPRITLTAPALTAAREIVFLVAGEDKAGAARAAFAPSRADVPARRVAEAAGRVTVVLDRAAAAELPPGGQP